jgi:hypothetical protein
MTQIAESWQSNTPVHRAGPETDQISDLVIHINIKLNTNVNRLIFHSCAHPRCQQSHAKQMGIDVGEDYIQVWTRA